MDADNTNISAQQPEPNTNEVLYIYLCNDVEPLTYTGITSLEVEKVGNFIGFEFEVYEFETGMTVGYSVTVNVEYLAYWVCKKVVTSEAEKLEQ